MNEEQVRAAFNDALRQLQGTLTEKPREQQLCARLFFTSWDGKTVFAGVGSSFHRDQLTDKGFAKQLSDILEMPVSVEVVKTEGLREGAENADVPNSPQAHQGAADFGDLAPKHHTSLDPDFTFDAFVPGDNNIYAYNAAKVVAGNPGSKEYNPLLIYGGVGLGKTHLMHAIGNSALRNKKLNVICVTAEEFTNEFIGNMKTMPAFKKKYRSADLLLIDDIHFFEGKDGTQQELFATFEALYGARKGMVFTCDRPISELKNFTDRMLSRFTMGKAADLNLPTYEVRFAILEKTMALKNKPLDNNVVEFLAQNVTSNVRDLKGALSYLIDYKEMTGKTVTLEVAKKMIMDNFKKVTTSEITVEQVQRAVAEHYHLTAKDLQAKNRQKKIANIRHIAIFVAKKLTNATNTEIGEEFGGRDHSTVIHSLEFVETNCLTDADYDESIKLLIRQIRGHSCA